MYNDFHSWVGMEVCGFLVISFLGQQIRSGYIGPWGPSAQLWIAWFYDDEPTVSMYRLENEKIVKDSVLLLLVDNILLFLFYGSIWTYLKERSILKTLRCNKMEIICDQTPMYLKRWPYISHNDLNLSLAHHNILIRFVSTKWFSYRCTSFTSLIFLHGSLRMIATLIYFRSTQHAKFCESPVLF